MSKQSNFVDLIKAGDAAGVEEVLAKDPSLASFRDENGVSALMWSLYTMHPEIAAILLQHDIELNHFESAAAGRVETLKALLEEDPARLDAYSPDGFTALGFACFFGQVQVAQLLLESGANPDSVSQNGMRVSPVHSAAANRDGETALALVRVLVERGAEVNVQQEGGWTPLHQAAHHGQEELVTLLLEKGADRAALSADGQTPEQMARSAGFAAVGERIHEYRS